MGGEFFPSEVRPKNNVIHVVSGSDLADHIALGHEPTARPHPVLDPRPGGNLFVGPDDRVGDVRALVQADPREDHRARTYRFLVARDVEAEIGAPTLDLDELAGWRTRADGAEGLQKIERRFEVARHRPDIERVSVAEVAGD